MASASRARKTVGLSYSLAIFTALCAAILVCVTSHLWSKDLGFLASDPLWIVGFSCATAAYTIFMIEDPVLIGLDSAKWIPLENGLFAAAKLIILAAIVGALPTQALFIAWSLPAAAAALIVTYFIFTTLTAHGGRRLSTTAFNVRQFVSLAAANQLGSIFLSSSMLLAPIVVSGAVGAVQTAYFFVPWTITTGLLTISMNTAASLIFETSVDTSRLPELTRRCLSNTLRLLTPAVVVIIVAAPYLLRIYGSAYSDNGTMVLRLLAVSVIPNTIYTIGETLLRVQSRTTALVTTQALQCVLYLGLGIVLLNVDGIEGMAFAYLISQVLTCVLLAAIAVGPLLFRQSPSAPET